MNLQFWRRVLLRDLVNEMSKMLHLCKFVAVWKGFRLEDSAIPRINYPLSRYVKIKAFNRCKSFAKNSSLGSHGWIGG
jgi:hypothetical protein